MANGDRFNRKLTHKEVLDLIRKGYRPLLKRPMTEQQAAALALAEAWNDMARAAQGQRILQRLNRPGGSVAPTHLTGRHLTFGGLQPRLPLKLKTPMPRKPRSIGQGVFDRPQMKKFRKFTPKLPGYKPKGIPTWPKPPRNWRGPRGQTDPFPKQVSTMPWKMRQPWLRGYYNANPRAAAAAQREARRIIDWAHRTLR